MTPEKNTSYQFEFQHELELAWIDRNTTLFSSKASGYFSLVGRGAIIVDATVKRLGEGTLFTYFSKEQMEHLTDDEISNIVDDYDPTKEFVVLLLLPREGKRVYRVGTSEEQGLKIESGSIGISYART